MQNTLQIPFYVRYDEWISTHSLSGIWESIIWLEELLPKLLEISGIQSEEIKVNIKEVKWGCIIFGLDIDILVAIEIFRNTKDLYDIINFVDLAEVYKVWNDWVTNNQLWALVLSTCIWSDVCREKLKQILSRFLIELIKILPSQKDFPTTKVDWKDIPVNIVQKSHNLVQKSSFKKTLQPIFEWKISSIEYGLDNKFEDNITITQQNCWDYISNDQQILPDWINGSRRIITWAIVSIQKRKWSSAIIRIKWLQKPHKDLISYPTESVTIDEFSKNFPYDNLQFDVEVSRVTLFEKPKLIVHSITNLTQNTPF